MVTVTIAIKPYLARYMYVRYKQSLEPEPDSHPDSSFQNQYHDRPQSLIPIHLSHITTLYHFLQQLTVPHPLNAPWRETGNICFILPNPRYGKNPEVYNYIGKDAAHIIENEIDVEMRMELYEFLLENKFINGVMFTRSMNLFVNKYEIEDLVQEESLMRAFKRWRKEMRENK